MMHENGNWMLTRHEVELLEGEIVIHERLYEATQHRNQILDQRDELLDAYHQHLRRLRRTHEYMVASPAKRHRLRKAYFATKHWFSEFERLTSESLDRATQMLRWERKAQIVYDARLRRNMVIPHMHLSWKCLLASDRFHVKVSDKRMLAPSDTLASIYDLESRSLLAVYDRVGKKLACSDLDTANHLRHLYHDAHVPAEIDGGDRPPLHYRR